MKLKMMLDSVAATQEHNHRERLTAALYVGARLALEAVLAKSSYNSEARELLSELSGETQEPAAVVADDTEAV